MSVMSPIRSVTAAAAPSVISSSYVGKATLPIVPSVEKPSSSARRAMSTSRRPSCRLLSEFGKPSPMFTLLKIAECGHAGQLEMAQQQATHQPAQSVCSEVHRYGQILSTRSLPPYLLMSGWRDVQMRDFGSPVWRFTGRDGDSK